MVENLNGQPEFISGGPKNEYNKLIRVNFKLSLLGILVGIFLLPNLAYLSTITPEKLIELTNKERQTAGLNSLIANQLLTKAAILKAKAIMEANTFSHTINNKKFSGWIQEANYNYSYVGENLAIDFVNSESVMAAWENSPLHKKNLLSPYYREIGISTLAGKFQGQDTIVVVQIFGAPPVGSVEPIAQIPGLNYANKNLTAPELSLPNWQLYRPENLLTHSIINQELLPPYGNKLMLANNNNQANQLNTFIIQSNYLPVLNNFLIIFASLTLIYTLIFLFYYYFFQINKLVSA